jgi:hypothetical protein
MWNRKRSRGTDETGITSGMYCPSLRSYSIKLSKTPNRTCLREARFGFDKLSMASRSITITRKDAGMWDGSYSRESSWCWVGN